MVSAYRRGPYGVPKGAQVNPPRGTGRTARPFSRSDTPEVQGRTERARCQCMGVVTLVRAVSLVAVLSGICALSVEPVRRLRCRPAPSDALPSDNASLRRASIKARGILGFGDNLSQLYEEDVAMIYEFDSFQEYVEACNVDPGLMGPSPGGARSELGCTRQNVYQAIKRGVLDVVRVKNGSGAPGLYVPQASIDRYKRESLGNKQNRPSLRQRALMSVDKHVHGVWPPDRC